MSQVKVSDEEGTRVITDYEELKEWWKYISLDDKNQYLIIGRNPKNLFATSDNLFELVSEKNGEQTEFKIERYL